MPRPRRRPPQEGWQERRQERRQELRQDADAAPRAEQPAGDAAARPKAQPRARKRTEPKAQPRPEPQAETSAEPGAQPGPGGRTRVKGQQRRQQRAEPGAEPREEPRAELEAGPGGEPRPRRGQPRGAARRSPGAGGPAQAGPEPKAEPRAEPRAEKAQPRGDRRPQPQAEKAQPRVAQPAHPKSEARTERPAQPKAQPHPEKKQPRPEKKQPRGELRAGQNGQPRPAQGAQPRAEQRGEQRGEPRPAQGGQARPGSRMERRQGGRIERRPERRMERRHPPRLPADGIKARTQRGEFGDSWWAKRWVDVLESFGYGGRLARGRTYARGGAVLSMEVGRGQVTARVQGSRPSPYNVKITLPPLSDEQWARVIDAMAEQAIFAAKLQAGEMPAEIEEAFATAQVPLFPRSARDLTTTCSCPDPANPCKHIAAVYYLLGERFDSDPFLLFELRGRNKEQIGAALRDLRAEGVADLEPEQVAVIERAPALADLIAHFDEPAAPLDQITPHITTPELEAPLLRRYGPPPAATGEELTAVYRTLSKLALDRLLGGE